MSENDALRDLADHIFSDASDASDGHAVGLHKELWKTCEAAGIVHLTLPESAGGSGGSLTDAAGVLTSAGTHAVRLPLVETDLLAGWLLHAAEIAVPRGPLTAVIAPDLRLDSVQGRVVASGTLSRVPWASSATWIVALTGQRVILVDRARTSISPGSNIADEPRDEVALANVHVDADHMAAAPPHWAEEFTLRAALGRSLLLAGAAQGALAMAVRYAQERVQFGRPIGQMQAIQQELAIAAAEVAAATAASAAAAAKAAKAGFADPATELAIAVAKARCGEAAGYVARAAHQVHGAIGFTREHDLRLVTTRLWAWRDENGSEAYWNEWIGARALDATEDSLWPMVTA